jgi:glycosyltransferase involved in cell wall biosynthesis
MSDITLLSSDHEGFCIAAMEGLAFGAPLVSTRVAGVVEYLEDGKNGFFAEKTPEDLAEKMEKIVDLSESNFIDFQENSRRTALNYSLESYGKRLTKLFIDCYNS